MTICAACGYPKMGPGLCAYCLPVQALRYEPLVLVSAATVEQVANGAA